MSTVGVLGGGQLGRMLVLAGYPLGLRFVVLDPAADATAGTMAEHLTASWGDAAALDALASKVSLVTYEFENVPVDSARRLAERVPVLPPPRALEVAQDRLAEKTLFRELGIPTPPFEPVDSLADLERAVSTVGFPSVLKTRREGYDGKGQYVLKTLDDGRRAFEEHPGRPMLLEGFVPFEREVSILAVRGRDGEERFYPPVENHHREGILRLSLAPAPALPEPIERAGFDGVRRVLEALEYVGVLAIEFFLHQGRLLANEMAPRVHNSGHWTIEGSITSQFENHLRAVTGLPLGSTAARGHAAMVNLVGSLPDPASVLAIEEAHLHLYGKLPRPGRKVGHVTVVSGSPAGRDVALEHVARLVDEPALRARAERGRR